MKLLLMAFLALSFPSRESAGVPLPANAAAPVVQAGEGDFRTSVVLDLRDGSRIIGTPLLTGLTLRSAYGPISFTPDQIRIILFSDSAHEVNVGFRNGDVLHGSLQLDSMPVRCAAGRLEFPVSAILRISAVAAKEKLAEGLIAHYPLGGNTADATGRGHDAVNHGAVPAQDRFGHRGGAYEFDGTAACIKLPEGIIDPNGPACTLSLWVLAKPSSVHRHALYIGAATGELGIWASGGQCGFGVGLTDRQPRGVTAPLMENTFVHIAGVYTRGKSFRLYVNGDRKAEAPVPDLPLISGQTEYSSGIGAYAPEHPEQAQRFGGANWLGRIGDVRIYDRALSDEELRALAHSRD